MPNLNDLYSDCSTREEYTETCSRINLWMCCDLDPEVAMEYLRRKGRNDEQKEV